LRIPKIVEEGKNGVKFVRNKDQKLYKLICPKCSWPLEFHLKTGRKSHVVWECTNPFCPFREWRVGLKSWKPNYLQVELLSMCVVPENKHRGEVIYNRQEVYTLTEVEGNG